MTHKRQLSLEGLVSGTQPTEPVGRPHAVDRAPKGGIPPVVVHRAPWAFREDLHHTVMGAEVSLVPRGAPGSAGDRREVVVGGDRLARREVRS